MPALRKVLLLLPVFIFALLLAAAFDSRVAAWVHAHGLHDKFHNLRWPLAFKWAGHYGYCTIPLAILIYLLQRHWRGPALILLSGIFAGLFYTVAKWCVGRTRPFPAKGPAESPFTFHPFNHGVTGLWKAENQAFPSGHACLAFATATALALLYPNWRWAFFFIASLTALERVLENVHYPSDVVAGASLGIFAALLTDRLLPKNGGRSP